MRLNARFTGLRSTLVVSAVVLALMGTAGCGKRTQRPSARMPKPVRVPKTGETQKGIASWYGHPYHGRRAANGEVYDMNRLTAAHREWPFELMVRVKNLANGKEVDVRITDRGPFVDGRIIDLSRSAAQKIEMIGPGIVDVKLTVLGFASGDYAVQLGAFQERDKAEAYRARMEKELGEAILAPPRAGSALHAVWYRRTTNAEEATRLVSELRRKGVRAILVRQQKQDGDE